MDNTASQEKAFLAWLNSFKIEKEPIKDLVSLQDGTFLMKFLRGLDSSFFSLEGFTIEPNHWSLCVSNIKKLNDSIIEYTNKYLTIKFPNDYINIQAIARQSDKEQILKLCEEVLGVAVNCKWRNKYIEAILGLSENLQAVLMEIIQKFVQKEVPNETEVIASLTEQLQVKEEEKKVALEQVKTLEDEKGVLIRQIEELKNSSDGLQKELNNLKADYEEYKEKNNLEEATTKWNTTKKSFEGRIANLTQEITSTEKKAREAEQTNKEEIAKLRDELFINQQKIKKSEAVETLLDQQKKKYEELLAQNQVITEEMGKINALESHVASLESAKKELEEKSISLIEELYEEKATLQNTASEVKRLTAENTKLEKEIKRLEDRVKQSDQRTITLSEELTSIKKEHDLLKIEVDAGSLLSSEKEEKYQLEIKTLKTQIDRFTKGSGETLQSHILELEDKLKVSTNDKQKLSQELILLNRHQKDLDKENDSLKTRLEYFTRQNENELEYAKEYQELKFERGELTKSLKEVQEHANSLELQNKEFTKMVKDLEKLKKDQEIDKATIKTLSDANMELEKKSARDEEKIALMMEERNKLEVILKSSISKSDIDYTSKLEEETEKLKVSIKEKYKTKMDNMKEEIELKQKALNKLEEELKAANNKAQEKEIKQKQEFTNTIKELTDKHENEKRETIKAFNELAESSKKEEKLLSSALYEMGLLISKMTKENMKDTSGTVSQILLQKLADERHKGDPSASGFISVQTGIRSQSNAKKP